MKWTGLNDLRESYLKFFESKGHLRMASAPLVPQGDNSVLLINAGMTPLKKYFQGIEEPPRHRVTTCQKCIRTPDIDNVGKTARHGTYFEMLGNFSFGDYFKHEATAWAWEYLTKVLEIPEDRLWVTIYEKDDEAGDIWANEVGVPRDRIIKLGKADNAIDLYIGEDYMDVLADGAWENIFKVKPAVFTTEEKKAWLATMKGVSLGSDAFFPFGDNIERAHRSGVEYIAQPGGSIRDDNVIDTCNKYGIAMAFTGIRLFHH